MPTDVTRPSEPTDTIDPANPADQADPLSRLAELLAKADVVDLDARAVRKTIELVEQATAKDLSKPTPCAGWTVHGLLAHMATQHYGFAAASEGSTDPEVWKTRSLGPDPVAAYRESAERVIAAFSAEGVLGRPFSLPEFGPGAQFLGMQAIGFHFIDYVVHAWDVAQSLGLYVDFDSEVLDLAYSMAQAIPDGEARLAPGSAFGPAVPWSGEQRRIDAIVAMLGRSPTWPN